MEDRGGVNMFANDGSFMEMFRKKMEEERQRSSVTSSGPTGPAAEAEGASSTSASVAAEDEPSPPQRARLQGQGNGQAGKGGAPSQGPGDPPVAQTERDGPSSPRTDVSSRAAQSVLGGSRAVEGVVGTAKPGTEASTDSTTATTTATSTSTSTSTSDSNVPKQKKYSLLSHVGKRRDGKVSLKTGTVKKQRLADSKAAKDQDPWSQYMAEVEKYKAHVCGDEDKSRPLVK